MWAFILAGCVRSGLQNSQNVTRFSTESCQALSQGGTVIFVVPFKSLSLHSLFVTSLHRCMFIPSVPAISQSYNSNSRKDKHLSVFNVRYVALADL